MHENKDAHASKGGVAGYPEDALLIDMAMPVATHPAFWAMAMEDTINSSMHFPQRASSAPAKHVAENETVITITPPASSLNGDVPKLPYNSDSLLASCNGGLLLQCLWALSARPQKNASHHTPAEPLQQADEDPGRHL
jgi:hypothetical protein